MYDILKVVQKISPGCEAINDDNTFEGIVWPKGYTPPTKAEFDKEMARADVPQEVWAGAMMRALNAIDPDLLKRVDEIVAASDDLLMRKLWDRAAAFRRDDPMIAAVGASVDPPWSEADLDDLFRLAGSFNR